MRHDALVIGGLIAIMLGSAAALTISGMIFYHQRYTTYLEAQRTVLECRSKSTGDLDSICGPIPTLESIK